MSVTRAGNANVIIHIDNIPANGVIDDNTINEIKEALGNYRDFYNIANDPQINPSQSIPNPAPDYLPAVPSVEENQTQVKPDVVNALGDVVRQYKKLSGGSNYGLTPGNVKAADQINQLIDDTNELLDGSYCWTSNSGYVSTTCNCNTPNTRSCGCDAAAHITSCTCNGVYNAIVCNSCDTGINNISCSCNGSNHHYAFCEPDKSSACFLDLLCVVGNQEICSCDFYFDCDPYDYDGCRPHSHTSGNFQFCNTNVRNECKPDVGAQQKLICDPHQYVVKCHVGNSADYDYNTGDKYNPGNPNQPIGYLDVAPGSEDNDNQPVAPNQYTAVNTALNVKSNVTYWYAPSNAPVFNSNFNCVVYAAGMDKINGRASNALTGDDWSTSKLNDAYNSFKSESGSVGTAYLNFLQNYIDGY